MDPSIVLNGHNASGNAAPTTSGGANSMPASTPQLTPQSTTPVASAWPSQMSTTPANNSAAAGPSFPQFSASTAAILERVRGNGGHASGSAAFEAKRAEILQNYVTSDKLPTPPPIPSSGRRGRGGRVGTPSALRTEAGASPAGASPARASGRGRGRGRGRARARGGKRKRPDSEEDDHDDDNSDISSSYTPLPTRTKSGRSVNKPVAFVPTLPEPSQGIKRRKSTKTNEVVTVLEKEWLCEPCLRLKRSVVQETQNLVAAQNLSIDEKRAYFSTLSKDQLLGLLLTATIRHPELPIFPPNVQDLIPKPLEKNSEPPVPPTSQPFMQPQYQSSPAFHNATISPPNGHISTNLTPHSHDFSDIDPAKAQLLGEYRSQQPAGQPHPALALAGNQYEEDDGYDTDPPAHYPKPGNGLARTLRPESEDLNWLVDDNFEVFSHGWKGDGTGMGADGTLDSMGSEPKVA
ncbi:hypothetical protein N0V83_000533 [Neocucurbitaria cava]|uniref:Uncharacterized protein n=1 Tax=Neocucurbitaria cava TaxID=798079 RepID=A0A9W8YHG6_9PLEO|nr:hypothetical protein N0V83_000533 [Neocucurbitaria cava]